MRKRYFVLILILVFVSGATLFKTEKASAAFNTYGRAELQGYFDGRMYGGGFWAFWTTPPHPYTGLTPDWPTVNITTDSFIEAYRTRLYSTDFTDASAAAGSILMMMGVDANDPRMDGPPGRLWNGEVLAQSMFAQWANIVRYYDSQGRVNFNDYVVVSPGEKDWLGATDVPGGQRYPDMVNLTLTIPQPVLEKAVVFTHPNGERLVILQKCANMTGDVTPLVPPPPPPPATVVQCGALSINAVPRPEVGQPLSVTVSANFTGGPPNPVAGGTIRVRGPGFDQEWTGRSPDTPPPPGPAGGSINFTSPSFTPTNPGLYTVAWIVGVNESNTGICGGNFSPGDSFEVMNYPFFEVKGGDVAAGSGIITDPTQTCGTPINNTNAGVTSWNRNSGAYPGAGGQYATFAWNFIQEFNTAKGSGRAPNYLAFSNNPATGQVNLGAGRYGGFGRPTSCIDQWKDVPATPRAVPNPAGVDLNSLDDKPYYHNGNVTINASSLSPGKKVTMYVSGDVRIAGDIVYGGANATWSDLTQIPSFKLVVKGNIHISWPVRRIDGTYVAVPDTPNYTSFLNSYAAPRAGTISTCSNHIGYATLVPNNALVIGLCSLRLEVNGSLSANQIFFLRTSGTMSNGVPAEQVNFNPETWLSPSGSKTIDPAYQSVVGLPPVL